MAMTAKVAAAVSSSSSRPPPASESPRAAILRRRVRHLLLRRASDARSTTSASDPSAAGLSLASLASVYVREFGEPVEASTPSFPSSSFPDVNSADTVLEGLASDPGGEFVHTYLSGKPALALTKQRRPAATSAAATSVLLPQQHFPENILQPKSHLDLMVQDVCGVGEFYVSSASTAPLLEDMMNKINKEMSGQQEEEPSSFVVGDLCAAVFEQEWHRAEITELRQCLDADGECHTAADLFFVDYGTRSLGVRVEPNSVRRLTDRHALLSAQAIRARLAGCRDKDDGEAAAAAGRRFLELVRKASADSDGSGAVRAEVAAVRRDKDSGEVSLLSLHLLDSSSDGGRRRRLSDVLLEEGLVVEVDEDAKREEEARPDVAKGMASLVKEQTRMLCRLRKMRGDSRRLGRIFREQEMIHKYLQKLAV